MSIDKKDKLETLFEIDQISTSASSSIGGRSSASSDLTESLRSNSWIRHLSSKGRRLNRGQFLKGSKVDACLTPFYLRWSFGLNISIPVLNLTIKNRPLIFYTASHAGIMYDYSAKEMRPLQGHKNLISSIDADNSGKWLVTADAGEDNTIIVWDSFECTPVNTIFNPHPNCGTAVVAISGNAKYLISVSNENKPTIKFWLWTYGNDQPDDVSALEMSYGPPITAKFNPQTQEHFIIAFQKQIVFLEWDGNEKKLSTPTVPIIQHIKKFGTITDCTYIYDCHECVASTTEGYLLVFGSTLYALPFHESDIKNRKIFVKGVQVSKSSITCIASVDGVIATGDTEGHTKFYDKRLRILYWCQNFQLPSVISISFNLEKRLYKLQDGLDFNNG